MLNPARRTPPAAPDAFETPQAWLHTPDQAFATWLQSRGLRGSSQTVYNAMWGAWLRHLAGQGKTLLGMEAGDLRDFLDGQSFTRRHHRRCYVRLVEQAFAHMARLGVPGRGGRNPGLDAARERVGDGEEDESRFLTGAERARVIARLETGRDAIRRAEESNEAWTAARDHALVGAMIGAGLSVAQARGVPVNCLGTWHNLPELFVRVPPRRGADRAHEARILPFARDLLLAWYGVRMASPDGAAGLLFPTARRPRGLRPGMAVAPLHAATVFRRTHAFLEACGVTGERACAQTLRNTYAALLIDGGADDAELTECLGFSRHGRSAPGLRAAYLGWQRRNPPAPAGDPPATPP